MSLLLKLVLVLQLAMFVDYTWQCMKLPEELVTSGVCFGVPFVCSVIIKLTMKPVVCISEP